MDLKRRLKATGVTARALAARIGVVPCTMTRNLNSPAPEPAYAAWIEALEIMSPEQRAAWLSASPPLTG